MPHDWSWITTPNDWYWYVGDDLTQVYSSKRGVFVLIDDAQFVGWLASTGKFPSTAQDVIGLVTVLTDLSAPLPVDATVLIAYKDILLRQLNMISFRLLFNHENHIRSLNREVALSEQEFIDAIKDYL